MRIGIYCICYDDVCVAAVAAADGETASSSSASDAAKSSPVLQSSGTRTNSSSQQPSNLPPRLQKKQRKAEEENYMKYYKPMDYIRQNNSYHRKLTAEATAQQGVESTHQNGGPGSARRVCDVNSRGSITNRKLWTDDLASASNGQFNDESGSNDSSVQSNMNTTNFHQSGSNDARLSNSAAYEQKPPSTILTSTGNKPPSLEAGIASLSIQSSASNHVTSQPSRISTVSVSYVNVVLQLVNAYCHLQSS